MIDKSKLKELKNIEELGKYKNIDGRLFKILNKDFRIVNDQLYISVSKSTRVGDKVYFAPSILKMLEE